MSWVKHYSIPLLQDLHAQSKEFNVLTSIPYLGIGLLVTWFLSRYLTPKGGKGAIRQLGGFSIFTAWEFFTRRHDLICTNYGNDSHFKFKIAQYNIVALRGEESRKAYFDNKSFDFNEGYKILLGAAPILEDIDVEEIRKRDGSSFSKQVTKLSTTNKLSDVLPSLFSDLNKRMEAWGKHGRMDPFNTIYSLVFQMTMRISTCPELSDNLKAVDEIQALYWTLEKSTSPTAILFPWFPGPARKRKNQATKDLFMKLMYHVELRRNATVPSSSAIDTLIKQGLGTVEIVHFVLSVIFAGVANTGTISCWALIYLSFHADWKAKVKAEVDALIRKHTANSSNEPLYKRLATIDISAWEDELPVLDLVLRESIRLASNGFAFRRNLLEDTTIAGGLVERGDFVAYPISDVHWNPDIYSSPDHFDPARFTEGREEDRKGTYLYLGWGAGRHPCTGMRVAKLEFKVMMAFIFTAFEFSMVDKFGKPLTEVPKLDRNDIHQSRPLGDPCYLQFDRKVD